MKSVGLQYIEAISELWRTTWRPKRTVYVSFVPDEEVGGRDGMGQLIESEVFASLNIGVALDEGLPRDDGIYNCYYGERQTWWLTLNVTDRPGHGSNLPESTAAATLNKIISKAMRFRDQELNRLKDGVDMGEIIGVNIAYLKSGYPDDNISSGFTMNVIASVAEAGFDIRVPPTIDAKQVDSEIESWLTCGDKRCPGVTIDWVIKVNNTQVTSRIPEENPYATPFMIGLRKAGIADDRLSHGIFRAATDARYLRLKGIPSFGFSPINKSPNLLHKHNEYLPVDTYMRGIRIYQSIIREIADYIPAPIPDTCETCDAEGGGLMSEEKEDL
ncbi:Peptidase M20 [Gracilaria domingensis]|nr:Peptidase M20 [Gracilaria domingensis]